jgi:hypothetical protein
MSNLERDLEKGVVKTYRRSHALSTLPRSLDYDPNERHGAALGHRMALPALWSDDGPWN